MYGRILGFHRLVRCPKWTPASSISFTLIFSINSSFAVIRPQRMRRVFTLRPGEKPTRNLSHSYSPIVGKSPARKRSRNPRECLWNQPASFASILQECSATKLAEEEQKRCGRPRKRLLKSSSTTEAGESRQMLATSILCVKRRIRPPVFVVCCWKSSGAGL
jgi:hypothetical protein